MQWMLGLSLGVGTVFARDVCPLLVFKRKSIGSRVSLILQDIGFKFSDLLSEKLNNRNKKTQREKVHTLQNPCPDLSQFYLNFILILS